MVLDDVIKSQGGYLNPCLLYTSNLEFIEKVRKLQVPILLLINKIDLTNQEELVKLVEEWHELIPQADVYKRQLRRRWGVNPAGACGKANVGISKMCIRDRATIADCVNCRKCAEICPTGALRIVK